MRQINQVGSARREWIWAHRGGDREGPFQWQGPHTSCSSWVSLNHLVYSQVRRGQRLVPDVGWGSAGEGGYHTEDIYAERHRLGRPRPRACARASEADPGICLCHSVLPLLNFQKEEEICLYFSSLGEHLSLRWKFDLQQPDLGGMEENFLSLQLENILQTLRWYGIYPAIVSNRSNFKMTLALMAGQYNRLDNLETFHHEHLERLDKTQQTFI